MASKLYFPIYCRLKVQQCACTEVVRQQINVSRAYALHRRGGVVVKASALQSIDVGFIPLVASYQKTLENGIHSFPAWRSAFRGSSGE